jgi:hypothetical protein
MENTMQPELVDAMRFFPLDDHQCTEAFAVLRFDVLDIPSLASIGILA